MKLWAKDNSKKVLENIENFTVGLDRELDIHLALYDVYGSIAHATMLETIGLLSEKDLKKIKTACSEIINEIEAGDFVIEDNVEDVHSQVEFILTQRIGDAGKKIHSGRSRNDQVLVDLKMYLRGQIESITMLISELFEKLIEKSEAYKEHLLPGYTHLQIAMPSSFGLWFGAYAESLIDDLTILHSAYKVVNKNPLGSGAGYGSSFPLNRTMTTQLLGFDDLNYNVVYAQMTRGKMEYVVSSALSNLANTLNRLAMDVCLYNSQNFGFLILPEEITTGSSIMPHKKNPDVAEILRGKTNLLKTLPTQVSSLLGNLPSGYHRELQLLKELIVPAFDNFRDCLEICIFMIDKVKVKENLLEDKKYDLLFSVENVNEMVQNGKTFRDAYKEVGESINDGNFTPNRDLNHTLEGSIGNLCNEQLSENMKQMIAQFNFEKTHTAFAKLKESLG
ncbi:argininosuccinate lyase [Jiulongibacter sp. NS-SX5]|uniref:argininosuccinate lyase n=1 Tax=Jiulongibacter sp. NS-SX5 TaxID=3463854 RepID=UPI00405A22F6